MQTLLYSNSLARRPGRAARQAAFSLVELVVSVGVLVLMLALAGQVFNLTIQSTGQATALTEVSQLLRAFESQIREDLRDVQKGRSIILIQGNPVNAYWTQEGERADDDGDPATGYPHVRDPLREKVDSQGQPVFDAAGQPIPEKPRADVLMFTTARRGVSYSHPDLSPDLVSNMQLVTYGQAELGNYQVPAGVGIAAEGEVDFQPVADRPMFPGGQEANATVAAAEAAPVPAESWHLSRRGVLLVPADLPDYVIPEEQRADLPLTVTGADNENQRLMRGKTDVIGNFDYTAAVLTPSAVEPWYLPQLLQDVPELLSRSQLDVRPPALLANRMGSYFLPNCASFKVEWSLDPRSEFVAGRLDGVKEVLWFDPGRYDPDSEPPEHPLTELERAADRFASAGGEENQLIAVRLRNLLDGRTWHPDGTTLEDKYSLADRFLGMTIQQQRGEDPTVEWAAPAPDGRPNLAFFGATRCRFGTACGRGDIVEEDIFPAALRITVDLYDANRRLDRPIRHVMVIPIGSG